MQKLNPTSQEKSVRVVAYSVSDHALIYGGRSNRYSISVMLAATSILWLTQVAFQLIYPQGSLYPDLQCGMLAAFILVSLCYIISVMIVASQEVFA